jgi:predicted dehydrogenase
MGRDLLSETASNTRAEIAALCDIDPDALKKAGEILGSSSRRFADHREMIHAGQLDAVVVAVPQHLHAALSIETLDAGLSVFCEKPMAMNVAECEEMIAAAKRNNKVLMIGHVLRYINPYKYVLEMARSGNLGKPFAVRLIRTMGKWGDWTRPWRCRRDMCGGLLLEVNVHEIDFMRCILGRATLAHAAGRRFINDEIDYEDFITATIAFESGIGTLTTGSCDYLGRYTGEIYLERGSIYFDSISGTVHVRKDGEGKRAIPYAEIEPGSEGGVHREMREFVETVLGEGPVTISGDDGLRNVEIAETCYRSIQESRSIPFPLTTAT